MPRFPLALLVRLGAIVLAVTVLAAGPATAQTLGTFTWQVQPYCNVLVVTLTSDGASFRVTGYDDQCGAAVRTPVSGAASLSPNGTYALSYYEVHQNGLSRHTRAVLDPRSITGPWIDSGGEGGTLVFSVRSPAAGVPRPAPVASSFSLPDASVTTAKIAAGAIDSARIADGSVTAADLADGSVGAAKIVFPLARTLSSPGDLFTLVNTGTGRAASLVNDNTGVASNVLQVTHAGNGPGLGVRLTNASNAQRGVEINHSGTGPGLYSVTASGNALWGVTSSAANATVLGENALGDAVFGRSSASQAFAGVVGQSQGPAAGVRGLSTSTGIGVFGQAGVLGGTGVAARFENSSATNAADVVEIVGAGTGDLIQATQGTNVRFRVTATGAVQADLAYSTPAADVAEFIEPVEPMLPGDVVEIDPAQPGRFRLAATAASSAVAGVVTTEPGVLLNSREGRTSVEHGPALALVGRVPVKVSAENGAIAPGDLLVASATAGHAMKAPAVPAAGTVIGKALGVHASGTGTIEMLVMLR